MSASVLASRPVRVLLGVAVLAALVIGSIAVTVASVHTWGATASERTLRRPGDELIAKPLVAWRHGITIDAPPGLVWPWIAQMGDTRRGFCS